MTSNMGRSALGRPASLGTRQLTKNPVGVEKVRPGRRSFRRLVSCCGAAFSASDSPLRGCGRNGP